MDKNSELQFERIVFFSDAVFAIAITLLVIEIKVPHLEATATTGEFVNSIIRLIPNFVGFFLSFVVVGANWVGHHRIYGYISSWNYGLIWRNVFFLMGIAFMPFSTAFFSEYPGKFVPLVVYATNFSIVGILEIVQWRYAIKSGLIRESATANELSHLTWRMGILPCVGVLAIAIGIVNPYLAGFAFLSISVAHALIKRRFKTMAAPEPVEA